MNYKRYKLKFLGPVHFGKQSLEDGEYTFCADTLFSALCHEAVRMGEDILQNFYTCAKNGELLLSDAFPFIQDTYYLPKPIKQYNSGENREDARRRKEYKRLAYIPEASITEFLRGNFDLTAGQKIKELGNFEMKVSASIRGEEETKPYRIRTYYYAEGNGVYFIVGYDEPQKLAFFETLINSLSFNGIGGKRAAGMGRFTYTSEELPPELVKRLEGTGENYMSLSVSLPQDNELDAVLEDAEYVLSKRSGFAASENYASEQMRKRDLYVLKAGACFTKKYKGDIYDVSDKMGKHPVYRYAKPIFMEVDA